MGKIDEGARAKEDDINPGLLVDRRKTFPSAARIWGKVLDSRALIDSICRSPVPWRAKSKQKQALSRMKALPDGGDLSISDGTIHVLSRLLLGNASKRLLYETQQGRCCREPGSRSIAVSRMFKISYEKCASSDKRSSERPDYRIALAPENDNSVVMKQRSSSSLRGPYSGPNEGSRKGIRGESLANRSGKNGDYLIWLYIALPIF